VMPVRGGGAAGRLGKKETELSFGFLVYELRIGPPTVAAGYGCLRML